MGRKPVGKSCVGARLKQGSALVVLMMLAPQMAVAGIDSGTTSKASSLGSNPDFNGGTLVLDSSTTLSQNFTIETNTSSTIDAQAHSVVFSGVIADADSTTTTPGQLTFTDTVGGGTVTLTGVNTMTGAVTVNSGVTLALSGSGSLASASSLGVGGTFDISKTTAGTSIVSLAGAGRVVLGSQDLTLSDAAGTFSGVISGSGKLVLLTGAESLTGANTYTGGTTITGGTLTVGDGATNGWIQGNVSTAGTLAFYRSDKVSFGGVISGSGGLSQTGSGTLVLTGVETYTGATTISAGTLSLASGASIANSSTVNVTGTFDISATSGTAIRALEGSGTVQLGGQTLTFTNGSGTFSGTIAGTGGIVVAGGTETLTGALNYTGATVVQAGTLQLGGSSVGKDISNSGTVSFSSGGPLAMSGVISGSGMVSQTGTGVTTISSVQTYTGATVISTGTLALSGAGRLAGTSDVTVNGTFDISAASAAISIPSLSGTGTVNLGSDTLTLSAASGTFSGVLAGTGNLVLTSGQETLGGTSSMTGTVTVTGGTLYLSSNGAIASAARVIDDGALDISAAGNSGSGSTASIQSLSGSGSVVLGDRTLIISNAADTFSGVISGSGGVTITGGTQVLTGANSYTGTTTISAGILALSGDGSLAATGTVNDSGTFDISAANGTATIASLAGSGKVVLGANDLRLADGADVFGGVISGKGGLAVTGGTETLAGANSYTGGTTIEGGTLQIGNGGTVGSLTGDVTDDGTLAFDRTDTVAFAGVISGSGRVEQMGLGITALTGANSYSGGTVISSGTLQIGNGGTGGSITGDVTDNGTLAFDRSDATSFDGTITGTGGVSQIGSGTLTLTALSSYTGTTTIASGSTLVLAAGAGIASSSDVVANGVLDLTALAAPRLSSLGGGGSVLLGAQSLGITAGDDTFSGDISGAGGLAVSGGTQVLSGLNRYTGATTVTGGTLTVNGSIASSSSVTGTGTLGGSGTTSSVTVAGGGTLAPGSNGSGTLKIAGNLTMANDSHFVVTESGAGAGSVSVSGDAALGGTLSVASTDGSYLLGQKIAVLTAADGIDGSFTEAEIASTGAQFKSAVTYDANHVYLEIDLAKLSPLLPADATIDQAAPVAGIDRAIAAGATVPVAFQNLGNLTSAKLAGAAGQLSGQIAADLPRAAGSLVTPFQDALFARLADRNGQHGVWTSVFTGSDLTMGDTAAGSSNFKSHADGIAGGIDWMASPRLTLGVALSAANSGFHVADDLGTGKADAYQAAIYGLMRFTPRFYGAFAGMIGVDDITTSRTVTVSGSDQLMGKVDPVSLAGRYETGVSLGPISPYAAIDEALTILPSYAETAVAGSATFAVGHAAQTANSTSAELGVRQSASMPFGRFWTVSLSDRLAWSHILDQPWSAATQFTGLASSDFTVYGAKAARDGALVSLGMMLRNRSGLGLDLHFEGRGGDRSQSYTGMAGLSFAW